MGNNISLNDYEVAQTYNDDLWQLEAQREHSKIYRNLQTGQLCQEYFVELPSGKIKDDIEIYDQRFRTEHSNIVKVYYVNFERPSALCSTKDSFIVRTEMIPYRINELPPMSIPEALYVLQEVFSGFSQIAEKYTHVRVQSSMIGLSSDGKVKVWLNSNFSLCEPQEYSLFTSGDDVHTLNNAMIKQITEIIQAQTIGKKLPEWVKLNIFRALSFHEAIQVINQFRGAERLTMTSLPLPGSTQKQLSVLSTLRNARSTHQLSPLQKNSQVHINGSHTQMMSPPSHFARAKGIPSQTIRNSSIGTEVKKNVVKQTSHKSMPNQFPAQFIQSQIVKDVNLLKNNKISMRSANLNMNREIATNNPNWQSNRTIQTSNRTSEVDNEIIRNNAEPNRSFVNASDQKNIALRNMNRPQNFQYNKQGQRVLTTTKSIPKLIPKLDIIPQNIVDTSVVSEQTARFIDQPLTTPRRSQKAVSFSYGNQNGEFVNRNTSQPVITITPPIDSGIRNGSRFPYFQNPVSINDQYINSSFTPVIIDRLTPEVTQSAPTSVFSNIQYGHGVIKNRQPKPR